MGVIDRTNFNALVDDDGSGTTGTLWNKTQIQSVILDPADAAYGSNAWASIAFNVNQFWPGVTAAMVLVNQYVYVATKTLLWQVQLSNCVAPSPATPYAYVLPGPSMLGTAGGFTPIALCTDNGAVVAASLFQANASQLAMYKASGSNWTGPISATWTAILAVA